ncbi:MAG: hypothetical protein ACR2N3_00170, partial [Pyrinomonadaceae bacterium]
MTENFCFQITEAEKKMRLDEFLFDKIRAVSRMYLRNLIAKEKCLLNGKRGTAGERLEAGDEIQIEVDLTAETSMLPENIPLEIIFEDEEIIVVNKQVGMLVHPTKGVKKGTLLNALSYHLNHKLQMTDEQRPEIKTEAQIIGNASKYIRAGLIHRLDRQT